MQEPDLPIEADGLQRTLNLGLGDPVQEAEQSIDRVPWRATGTGQEAPDVRPLREVGAETLEVAAGGVTLQPPDRVAVPRGG